MDERAFARTRGAQNGHRLAGLEFETDVLQDGRSRGARIAERDMVEHDGSAAASRRFGFQRAVVADGCLGIQHFVEAFGGDFRAGDVRHDERREHEGEKNLRDVVDHGDDFADGQFAAADRPTADPEDGDDAEIHEKHHGGHHAGHEAGCG